MSDAVSRSFQSEARGRLEGNINGIGVADIIASLNKQKIGTSYVPSLDKIRINRFNPDKKPRDFISHIQKINDFKKGPDTYKPSNTNFFLDQTHQKTIHFAYSKEAKTSVLAEKAKQ